MGSWTPLSVRHGNRRARARWRLRGARNALALRIAPWLDIKPDHLPPPRDATKVPPVDRSAIVAICIWITVCVALIGWSIAYYATAH